MRCGIDFAGLSFLVIDDSEFMRNAIRTVLGELGSMRVAEAADGSQAFEQIAWEEPDIIICDWLMRPMGGEGTHRAGNRPPRRTVGFRRSASCRSERRSRFRRLPSCD